VSRIELRMTVARGILNHKDFTSLSWNLTLSGRQQPWNRLTLSNQQLQRVGPWLLATIFRTTQLSLHYSQKRLQFTKFLMDHAPDAVFCGSRRGFCTSMIRLAAWLGIPVRITLYDYARRNPDLSPKVWSEQWRTLRQQGSLTFESRHRTKGRPDISVEITVTYVEYHGRV